MLLFYRVALVAAGLGLPGAAAAQAPLFYTIELPAAPASAPLPVYVARVVDARANKAGLGWINNGLDNTRRLARFAQGLEQELTNFFGRELHPPEARPLVLVVRRLTLAEQAAGLREYALAEVVADFYEQQPDGYHWVHHAAELATDHAFDVTSLHPPLLAQVLRQALAPLGTASLAPAASPALSWEALLAAPAPPAYAVETAAPPRSGLYRQPADFQRNQPWHEGQWSNRPLGHLAAYGARALMRRATAEDAWHDDDDLWGFCDGSRVYVRHGSAYYPLQHNAQGYFYQAPGYLDSRQRKSTAVLYTPGGGVMTKTPPKLTATTLQLWPDTGFAGEAIPATARADAPAAAATVIVYRRPDAAPDRDVQILLNGQPAGSLRGGEYLALPMPGGELAEVSVCGQAGRETCFRFRPDRLAANYLDCRLSLATQPAPMLRLVSAETGTAAVQSCVAAVPK